MKKLAILFVAILLSVSYTSFAQVDQGGAPISLSKKSSTTIPFVQFSEVTPKVIEQMKNENKSKKAQLIGKVIETNLSPQNTGQWEDLTNGRLWRLGINSVGAIETGLFLTNFELEEGVQLFVYPENHSYFIGAFTSANNKTSKKLPIRAVETDRIVIELFVPKYASEPEFIISEVYHNFKSAIKKNSGACNINVNCDLGNDWQIEKRAVAKYTFRDSDNGGTYSCSGSLINNTKFDQKPYFLTANHCVDNQAEAESAIFYFNYESTTCSGNTGDATQTLSASDFRATGPKAALDFTLIELSSTPPENYNPYYAGWNRNTTPATLGLSIHHPAGDIKKISIDRDELTTLVTPPAGWPDDNESHWKVFWDEGVTEGGSSGSPLFDENHRIVGDLSGGDASCSNIKEPDYFTKFNLSWNKYPGNTTSLAPWLDPDDSSPLTLDPLDPMNQGPNVELDEIIYPKGTIKATSTIVPKIAIYNAGTTVLNSINIKVYINENDSPIHTETWTGELSTSNSVIVELTSIENVPESIIRIELEIPEDIDTKNNVKTKNLTYNDGIEVDLELNQVSTSSVIAWSLSDKLGNVLYEKGDDTKTSVANYPFILKAGCYSLNIQPVTNFEGQKVELINKSLNQTIAQTTISDGNKKTIWGVSNTKAFCINIFWFIV